MEFQIYLNKERNSIAILHFCKVLRAEDDSVKVTTHYISPDLDLVPGAGLQSHITAACGVHLVTAAEGVVSCLVQLVTIDVEVAVVQLPAVHMGLQTEAHPPCSRHRHSEDP